MVEYILMLIIIVSLALGMQKAFSNLKNGMDNYIGKYIKCLMEYGELPSLGVSASGLNKHSMTGGDGKGCDGKFAAFTFKDGFGPGTGATGGTGGTGGGGTGGGGTGGSGGSGSGGSGSGGTSSSASGSNNGNSSSNAGKGGSGGGDSDGSDSGGGGSGRGKKGGSGSGRGGMAGGGDDVRRSESSFSSADGDGGSSSKSKILDDPNGNGDSDAEGRRNRRNGYRGSTRYEYYGERGYRAVTGEQLAEIEKANPPRLIRKPSTTVVATVKEGDGMDFGPSVRRVQPPPERKVEVQEEKGSGFGFGYMIRWLMIAGIILAIVIFFGGQLMNYSNSQD